MENLLQEYNINHWLIKFVLIIFIIIFINISTRVILSTLKKQFSKTNNIWDDCIIDSIYKPFTILIWILGIVLTLEAFNSDFKIFNISNDFLINLKRAGIILSIALFLNNLSRNFQFAIIKNNKTKIDDQIITEVLTVNGIRFSFDDGSWGLIRASSNKPSLVIVTESPTSDIRKKKNL